MAIHSPQCYALKSNLFAAQLGQALQWACLTGSGSGNAARLNIGCVAYAECIQTQDTKKTSNFFCHYFALWSRDILRFS